MKKVLCFTALMMLISGCSYPVGTRWGGDEVYNEVVDCKGDVYIGDYVLKDTIFIQRRVEWDKRLLKARGGQVLIGFTDESRVKNLVCNE